MQRRKVIKSLGVAGGAVATGVGGTLAIPGTAAAEEKELDTSDWIVDLDVEKGQSASVGTRSGPPETEVYVGQNKNADPSTSAIESRSVGSSGGMSTQNYSVSASATLLTWDIPEEVPIIGGDELTFSISASVGLGGVSASFDVCVGGECISLAGVNVGIGTNTVDVSTKGTFYGVPFELTVSVTLTASIGSVTNPDASLDVGASGEVCLGRDLCDANPSGWENVTCMLCASAGTSVTVID
ncbi:hypothetical protein [Halorussus aquaticus]|uniref:SipW-cognate class signal peptide n=1 Tax=Halorussus aquaticus TaxID=2953748 RepID=A0ABD5PY18_9EURY|nr:hypothetical protein [Halorussus aquaticus]